MLMTIQSVTMMMTMMMTTVKTMTMTMMMIGRIVVEVVWSKLDAKQTLECPNQWQRETALQLRQIVTKSDVNLANLFFIHSQVFLAAKILPFFAP